MPESYDLSVIMPTTARSERRVQILRAIDSLLGQKGARVLPLIVINGETFDPELRAQLEARPEIKTFYRQRGNLVEALHFGVTQVTTPFFGFLDDDDIYAEDAAAERLGLINKAPQSDIAVTNFHVAKDGKTELACPDITAYAADPAHSIFEFPWLWSGNSLYRTASIGEAYFRQILPLLEWTSLGVELARDKRFAFSNRVTATYFDTPGSLSKGDPQLRAIAGFMAAMRRRPCPLKTRQLIGRKYVAALHALSENAHNRKENGLAWRYHLRCLASAAGWRYLTFTRVLLR